MVQHDVVVMVDDRRWDEVSPAVDSICARAAALALEIGQLDASKELTILLANDAKLQALNSQYRGVNKPTNVLSFNSETELLNGLDSEPLGDIAIAYETVLKEAQEQEKLPVNHLQHLVIHGVLHVLGYDHETETDADAMEAVEIMLLQQLGIKDPYVIINDRGEV